MFSPLLLVGGIGDGLFIIFFFFALGIITCYFGIHSTSPGFLCLLGTLVPITILILFIVIPKGQLEDVPGTVYDESAPRRHGIMFLLFGCTLICAVVLIILKCCNAVKGSRVLREHEKRLNVIRVD